MLAWFWPFRAQTPQRIILGLRQNLLTTTGISNREEHPFPEKFVPMSQLTLPDDTKASALRSPARASPGFPSTLADAAAKFSRPCPPILIPICASDPQDISAQAVRRLSTVWARNEPEAFKGQRLATEVLAACLHWQTRPSLRHLCESYIQNGTTH